MSRTAFLALGLSALAPTPARGDVWCWHFHTGCGGGWSASEPSERAAPEVDPNALAGVLALVGGGAAILGDRLRRR
jgi:hypothetical protein